MEHCLNGPALAVLRSAGLGSLVTRLGPNELDEFRVGFRGRSACVPMPEGVAVSRSRLDAALVEAATAAGQFLDETHAVVSESRDGLRRVRLVQNRQCVEATARVVIVATGLGSPPLGNGSPLKTHVRAGSRIGAGCVVDNAPRFYHERTIFMAVGRDGYVGAVRIEDGRLNIAAALAPALLADGARQHWPPSGFWPRPGSHRLLDSTSLAGRGLPPLRGGHSRWPRRGYSCSVTPRAMLSRSLARELPGHSRRGMRSRPWHFRPWNNGIPSLNLRGRNSTGGWSAAGRSCVARLPRACASPGWPRSGSRSCGGFPRRQVWSFAASIPLHPSRMRADHARHDRRLRHSRPIPPDCPDRCSQDRPAILLRNARPRACV